jgi:small GTP-binding protein
MRLSELQTGQTAYIKKVNGNGAFRKRILEMGFVRGEEVKSILNAPLKDPIKYGIMEYEVSLRRSEAVMIEITIMKSEVTQNGYSENGYSDDVNILSGKSSATDELTNINTFNGIKYKNHKQEAIKLPNRVILNDESNKRKLKEKNIKVALIGNPNSGKTSIFNLASGAHEHVGNYSGVTIDAKEGYLRHNDYHFTLVDLPGTYSLSSYSPEELYARNYILEEKPDVIVNVVSASALERNLYLTTELLDLEVPMVIALNMYDELESSGRKFEHNTFSKLINVPIVPTVGKRGEGIPQLLEEVIRVKNEKNHTFAQLPYGRVLEKSISIMERELNDSFKLKKELSLRYICIKLLEGDKDVEKHIAGLPKHNQIILFIDEIHTLVGAGKSEGAMDAANILKPALSRGELRAIGATTLNEYQKYFEKDKALERRFQTVMVNEPSETDSISILRGLKERYENHHKVRIKDEAIIASVQLSSRYITDRFLPDKAIDLMDEAAAKLRMEVDSVPEELDELMRKVKQLEIEREAIKRENDQPKVDLLTKQIEDLKAEEAEFSAKWKSEKELINKIQQAKIEIEDAKFEAEKAEREGDYGKVAELRYGKIKEKENDIEALQKELHVRQGGRAMIKEEVDAEDIADVVSRWTGIPVSKMLQSERDKLLHLEEELHKRVIGQDEAITAVADAVRRSRAGLSDPQRPIGSFIFLGTTGVGKTELAKALAEYLFDDENMMTRIDMSEYQEKFSATRLIGAPPGYVGYDEGGQLTEAIRRKPYSVVLFDEIEKAHPDVFNILLQVLDDGRLTDNKGRVVNFKNTIIIMTSNMGSDLIRENFEKINPVNRDEIIDKTRNLVMDMLKRTIRPEFLNRIDETIMFAPLKENEITQIVKLQLDKVRESLAESGIELKYSDEAVSSISESGYDPEFGARPVKRVIQRKVLNQLSKELLSGKIDKSKPITIEAIDDIIYFKNN